jgi:hypothetical protein
MQFYIDVGEGSPGPGKSGIGPITSASYWRSTKSVDRIGSFEFAMPASDEKASMLTNRRYVTCYAILEHEGPTIVGSGIIDRIETRPGSNGDVEIVVTGDDILRELNWLTVGRASFTSGSGPITHANAVSTIGAIAATWSFDADPAPLNDNIFYYFSGEKVWAAILKLAELSRCHVFTPSTRVPSARILRFRNTWTSSGLRAIEAPANPGAPTNICYISGLTKAVDSYDLITRLFAFGPTVPSGSAPLDLSYYTAYGYAVDTGYTIVQHPTLLQYYLKGNAADATYGIMEDWIAYNDIFMNAAADIPAAAIQLYSLALYELQRRQQPVSYYTLELAYAPGVIDLMQTIRCVFRRVVEGRTVVTIDEDLFIMGVTTSVDSEGLRTTALEVATYDRWPPSDVDITRKLVLDNLRSNL